MTRFPDLPPLWALGAAALAWLLARHAPLVAFPSGAGRVLIAAGLVLVAWSAWWFRKKRTPIPGRRRGR